MPEEREPINSEEAREKILKALEEGRVEFAGTPPIPSGSPDFTVTHAEAREFWGPALKEEPGGTVIGNRGGLEIDWQTAGAGFGTLMLSLNREGRLRIDSEYMGREFCLEVLKKLLESAEFIT